MPDWFDPEWLQQEEAPPNKFYRERGLPAYQSDASSSSALPPLEHDGGGGDEGGGDGYGAGYGGGGGWWREDDPYWPMRDWGDHPMRWWTFGFAGVLAGAPPCPVEGTLQALCLRPSGRAGRNPARPWQAAAAVGIVMLLRRALQIPRQSVGCAEMGTWAWDAAAAPAAPAEPPNMPSPTPP